MPYWLLHCLWCIYHVYFVSNSNMQVNFNKIMYCIILQQNIVFNISALKYVHFTKYNKLTYPNISALKYVHFTKYNNWLILSMSQWKFHNASKLVFLKLHQYILLKHFSTFHFSCRNNNVTVTAFIILNTIWRYNCKCFLLLTYRSTSL